MIGRVVASSTEEVHIRLDDNVDVESLAMGTLLVIDSNYKYLARVHSIGSRNLGEPQLADKVASAYGRDVYSDIEPALGNQFYYVAKAKVAGIAGKRLRPAKTIPTFFSPARVAERRDLPFMGAFGAGGIEIGILREIGIPVTLSSEMLITRHCGVFGKTGSGKSNTVKVLVSRFLDAGAPCLIFDVHGEYARHDGLRNHGRVKVVGVSADEDVTISIPLSEIRPIDLQLVSFLNETQSEAVSAIRAKMGRNWIEYILKADRKAVENDFGGMIFEATVLALKRKVERLKGQGYIRSGTDSLRYILNALKKGRTIVVDLSPLEHSDYAIRLITTVISRYLLETYKKMGTESVAHKETLIVLEEAHKLLSKDKARLTIFESIVREGRKFGLGLMVVDQAPRKIHEEVISQLNTVIIMLLSNVKDREHIALASESNLSEFREEMARLDVGEAIVSGLAVPMPLSCSVPVFSPPPAQARVTGNEEFSFNE